MGRMSGRSRSDRVKSRSMDNTLRLADAVSVLLQSFLANERAFPSAEGQVSYSPHLFGALAVLDTEDAVRPSDLAKVLGLRPTTASSLIRRLVDKGLIKRGPHPTDARAARLSLTRAGAELRAAIRRQDMRNMDLMLSALSPKDQDRFVELIEQVAARVAEAAAAADQG